MICPHRTTTFERYRKLERNSPLEYPEGEERLQMPVTEENITSVRKTLGEDQQVTY